MKTKYVPQRQCKQCGDWFRPKMKRSSFCHPKCHRNYRGDQFKKMFGCPKINVFLKSLPSKCVHNVSFLVCVSDKEKIYFNWYYRDQNN